MRGTTLVSHSSILRLSLRPSNVRSIQDPSSTACRRISFQIWSANGDRAGTSTKLPAKKLQCTFHSTFRFRSYLPQSLSEAAFQPAAALSGGGQKCTPLRHHL